MARIKLPSNASSIDTRVPSADIRKNVGQEFGELAQLGGKMAEFGANLLAKRTQAENENYAFTNQQQNMMDINKHSDELKLTIPAGSKDYSTKMKEFIDQRHKASMENAPSEGARLRYQERSEEDNNRFMLKAYEFENKRNVEKWKTDVTKSFYENARLFESNPNYHEYGNRLKAITTEIDAQKGTLYDDDTAEQAKKDAASILSIGVLNGLHKQGRYKEGLDLLNAREMGPKTKEGKGTIVESDVAKSLSPEQKNTYLNQFEALQKQKSEVTASMINENIKDFQYGAMKNGNVDPSQLNKIIAAVNANDSMRPEQKARIKDTLKTTVSASVQAQKLSTMSTQELVNYKPQIDTSSTFNVSNRAEISQNLEKYRDELLKKRQEDPLQERVQHSPTLASLQRQAQGGDPQASRAYLDQALAEQQQLGVGRPRVSTKDESSFNAQQITTAPTADAAEVMLQKIQMQYGPYTAKALDEMARDKTGITHDYVIASYLPSQQARVSAIDNIRRESDINKNFQALPVKPDLKGAMSGVSDDLRSSLIQRTSNGDDIGVYNAFVKQVDLEAKKAIASDPSLSADKAVTRAYESIIEKNFDFVPSAKSNIIVPKKQGDTFNDPHAIQEFVGQYSNPDGFKKLDVRVPPSFQGDSGKQDWYNVAAQRSKWVTNSSMTGVQLVYVKPDTREIIPLANSKGQPIEKSFKDITLMSGELKTQSAETFKKMNLSRGMIDK